MKKQMKKSFSLFLAAILVINGLMALTPLITKAAESLPKVAIVSLDHKPFVEGDSNEFFISSKGYNGQVQYQLFYTCKTTMGTNWELINNDDMVNGWTKSVDAHEPIKVDISSLNLKAEYYRFAIRVRRVGYKGRYSNKYGDYDNAYPFVINVVKDSNIHLNGDMLIEKTEYTKNEKLVINGVDDVESDTKYKLHLYDVKNNSWMTNLTEFGDNINYDLSSIPAGKYIVDVWGKRNNSSKVYDGWKLKIIEVKEEQIPKVAIVSLDNTPFIAEGKNKFFISSKGYDGQVQYQLFYTCAATMGTKWELIHNYGMVDGWTKPVDAHEPINVDISHLYLRENFYRFAIRVRRVGYKGKYTNKYGDYDNAYPFVVNVVRNPAIYSWGDMLINKTEYAKNDQLIIDGVNNSHQKDTKYKLHLYDVKNNKWITNLTEYEEKISYDLSNIPAGTYIVDLWYKRDNSTKKYDGWKLKTINITSEIKKITSVEDVNVSTSRNSNYRLPETVMVTFEDGSSVRKSVVWDGIANTSKLGTYTFQGTVKGYNQKCKLTLTVEDVKGNTAGNIVNVAMVAKSNGWIYYTNHADEGKLYKMQVDGNNKTKVSNDIPLYINVVDDWIYYCNLLDYGKLYKIRIDGTGRTKLCNDLAEEIIVENQWIYYANAAEDYKLYKIKNDGTNRTKLNNDYSANANLANGFIYYTNCSDNFRVYRIKADGTGRTALNNDKSGFLNVVDGWIYYENLSDSSKIYRITTSGTNRAKVSDQSGSFLNAADGWIYYTNLNNNNSLYKMKIDGTSNQALNDKGSFFIQVVDEYVYYENESDSYNLYRIKNDGSENQKFDTGILNINDIKVTLDKNSYYSLPSLVKAELVDGSTINLYVTWNVSEIDTSKAGQYVYEGIVKGYMKKVLLKVNVIEIVSLEYDNATIVRPKGTDFEPPNSVKATMSDGSKKSIVMTWTPSSIDTSEAGEYTIEGTPTNKIYDKNLSFKLSVVESDNLVTGKVVAEAGDWIYYENIYDDNCLYRVKQDGTGKTKVVEKYVMEIIDTKDEWIYYRDNKQNSSLYRMKADGAEQIKLVEGRVYYWEIVDSLIYYTNPEDDNKFYSMRLDGTDKTKISDNLMAYPHVNLKDKCIYYSNKSDWGRIYKMNLDGTNTIRINTEPLSKFTIYSIDDQWIYYTDKRYNNMYKISIDGTQKIVLSYSGESSLGIEKIDGEWIYYNRSGAGMQEICKKKTDGTDTIKLGEGDISNIVSEWIYYRIHDGIGEVLYKMKIDGTEKQLVY
ncbi:DUF5050 domain-containing protein [Clostridium sp. ZS2-4]|uniref:DUF5050 domain-containing protein n=1 Tax=Clostridium sp. ZS2-4 TaxID=2987703 RepID=UPI002279F87D|nr:DUF5050 domain-containing protein [Clostridium sp. ZS2-4]MCY6355153.1 DUF5050 domain-containing protein [Clostridium sp. ZS2-4]